MRSNIVIWLVALLLIAGCGNDQSQQLADLSSKVDKANKEIESLKSENEKLKSDAPAAQTPAPQSLKDAEVTRVVDGDTVEVKIDGKKDTIRLLLIDTPETKDPNEPVQPLGPEASDYAKKTLEGKKIKIEMDGPERDKYKRLLAYIWIGDKIFNQMLIEEGLARVAYVYNPPYTHYDEFVAAEEKVKAEGKGIWSIDGYVTEDGFNMNVPVATEPPSSEVTTNDNVVVYYKNCTAARAAGVAPLYEGDPGYSTKLDRDRDGIACE